jgi:predicted acyltransferase
MTHSSDMVSTGICLNERGWFGKSGERKKMRICGYVLITLGITLLKITAVFLVTNSLLKQFFDPSGEVVKMS